MFWVILLLICIAVIAISGITYLIVFYSPARRKEDRYELPSGEAYEKHHEIMRRMIQELNEAPYEQVFITSHDGLKLAARYYHVKDGAPVEIEFHGYRDSAVRDFCGGNCFSRRNGRNTLLVDQRAHGKSEGYTISFGINERYDCVSWIQYLNNRFGNDVKIILSGISMGASTVLMASGLKLPSNVIAIVADCPYSSPKEIICKVCRSMKLPVKFLYPFIRLGAVLFGHFDPDAAGAAEAVKHSRVPILLIHGDSDSFVPCEMSRAIHESCQSYKVLELFPGADHGISYLSDSKRYEKAVEDFLEYCMARNVRP